jgi:hypothetical protein
MSTQHENVQIRETLESLTRQVSVDWRQHLKALRAALDMQISTIEVALDDHDHSAAIDDALEEVAEATVDQVNRARKQAEATAAQALSAIEVELRARLSSENAANIMLRTTLEESKKELESALNRTVRAEAAQRATAAQLEETLKTQKKSTSTVESLRAQVAELQAQIAQTQGQVDTNGLSLATAERQIQALSAERAELMQRVKDVTSAKALVQMVRDREPGRAAAAESALSVLANADKAPAKPASPAKAPAKTTAGFTAPQPAPAPQRTTTPQPSPVPVTASKKPLQFSEKARDAKRVKIRRGIDVHVDGIPGEFVDLSIGGAQALLRQAVQPNQLVRLVAPTATGQLICKGRIVWVVYEQPGTSLSVYRAGVKFTDVDAAAVETFMNDFCEKSPMQRRHSSGAA